MGMQFIDFEPNLLNMFVLLKVIERMKQINLCNTCMQSNGFGIQQQ